MKQINSSPKVLDTEINAPSAPVALDNALAVARLRALPAGQRRAAIHEALRHRAAHHDDAQLRFRRGCTSAARAAGSWSSFGCGDALVQLVPQTVGVAVERARGASGDAEGREVSSLHGSGVAWAASTAV